MPPKDWFYGIDYENAKRIVKFLEDNKIFDIYKFREIGIFLKDKFEFKDFFKLIYFYIFLKIKNPHYVFSYNASYIAYCNLIFKKKIINFFSQILNFKCILRWDHINEQIPNIVERILNKSNLNEINDYKKFFLARIDNKNFYHYSWQNNEYFSNKKYLENTLELKNFKFKNLNFFFADKENTEDIKLKKNVENKTIALAGYVNHALKPKISFDNITLLLKNKKNFFDKKYYQDLIAYSNYVYSAKKIELLKIKEVNFYGLNLIENYGKVVDSNTFYSEISKFFMIINPINPMFLTITNKFYLIFLNGGFCIHELPIEIPPKLEKFKEFIFYKDEKELIDKIQFLKNNMPLYFSIKKEIHEISKNLKVNAYEIFNDEFINS